MLAQVIQALAILLFGVCWYYATRAEGTRYAQQWFIAGYVFVLIREIIFVQFGVILYSDQMLQYGGAAVVVALLIPALFYVAYTAARRLYKGEGLRPMLYLVSVLVPALMLPVDLTGSQLGWWSYPSESFSFGGIPYFLPFGWAVTGALFYYAIWRVRRLRLRGSGQLFALLLLVPLLAAGNLVLLALVQVFVNLLAAVPGRYLLNTALGLLFVALPLAFWFGIPRLEKGDDEIVQ